MNILVADDQKDIRELLEEILALEGHEVHCVENGRQAIDLLTIRKIDLIITDIRMPEIEGVELILRLRQSGIPIITISGMSAQQVREELIASLGIAGSLQKPFSVAQVLACVNGVQGRNRQSQCTGVHNEHAK